MRTAAKVGLATLGLLVAVGVAGLVAIAPHRLPASELKAAHVADVANGRTIFLAGNCAACHATPGQEDMTRLGGGLKLKSPYGVFTVPNISPDPQAGIGAWSEKDFVDAVKRGVGRRGEHLYPAFPYTAYSHLKTADVRDLFAYLRTLPADAARPPGHQLKFPYNIRFILGGWKLLEFRPAEFAAVPARSAAWNRGAYLVEAAGHCADCHTPRDALGGMQADKLYAGAPNLEAGGRFASNITPHKDGLSDWSAAEIADFLKTGADKCFNEPTGMAAVLASTTKLPEADADAIAAYIAALPPKAGNGKRKVC